MLLAGLEEVDCCLVCKVVFLVDICIKLRLDLHVLGVEVAVLVDVVDVIILSVSSKNARKYYAELARTDLNVVADV
jgi:uncharacterized membrane protein